MQILHLDSSPRGEQSVSRRLTRRLVKLWKTNHSDSRVIYRDIGRHPLPHVNETWIEAALTDPADRTPDLRQTIALSDLLVDEFLVCDRYVFGIPIYNLSIPSTFKAYLDQIIRLNRTFTYENGTYKGLVTDKKMVIIMTCSDQHHPSLPCASDHVQEAYLRAVFSMIGIEDITFVHVGKLAEGKDIRAQSMAKAKATIAELAKCW